MNRYFLDKDNEGHYYLIKDDKRIEWEDWLESQDYLDGIPPDSEIAELCLNHPSNLTFIDPRWIYNE